MPDGVQNHVAPEQLYGVPLLAHVSTVILIVDSSSVSLTSDTDQQQTALGSLVLLALSQIKVIIGLPIMLTSKWCLRSSGSAKEESSMISLLCHDLTLFSNFLKVSLLSLNHQLIEV